MNSSIWLLLIIVTRSCIPLTNNDPFSFLWREKDWVSLHSNSSWEEPHQKSELTGVLSDSAGPLEQMHISFLVHIYWGIIEERINTLEEHDRESTNQTRSISIPYYHECRDRISTKVAWYSFPFDSMHSLRRIQKIHSYNKHNSVNKNRTKHQFPSPLE